MAFKTLMKALIPRRLLNLRHLFWAWWGAVKYHHPSDEIFVIGITGTSGKSSTVYFLRQMLESVGFKVGSLSTIDFYIAGENKLNDQKMTMLGKMQIQKYLREMVDKGCDVAIVETTSEGRLQYRHAFINYDMMLLTNLYPEHIESHGSFEAYKRAKLDIFRHVAHCRHKYLENLMIGKNTNTQGKIPKTAIVNGNSEYVEEFLQYNFDQKIVFSKDLGNNKLKSYSLSLIATDLQATDDGLHFDVEDTRFHAPLYGEHNIMNILGAISVLKAWKIEDTKIQEAVNHLKPAPGRIEFIPEAEKHGFQVIVDYAFEPGALKALYEVVDLLKPKGRVIHVCGSTGGGRDKARRIPIGEFVGKKSDVFMVTDEDPYDEDPMEIIKAVSEGAQNTGKKLDKNLFEVLDRKKAIEKAIHMAQPGDLVLITGKGSEQKMCVAGGKMIVWDDREIVRDALKRYQ